MLELIMPDTDGHRRGDCCVTLSGKLHRILFFKAAYEEMRRHHAGDFEYVQFLADSDQPGRFWMRPTTKEARGSVRIVCNPRNGTKTVSVAYLLEFLDWQSEQSVRCPVAWDRENQAAMVLMESDH